MDIKNQTAKVFYINYYHSILGNRTFHTTTIDLSSFSDKSLIIQAVSAYSKSCTLSPPTNSGFTHLKRLLRSLSPEILAILDRHTSDLSRDDILKLYLEIEREVGLIENFSSTYAIQVQQSFKKILGLTPEKLKDGFTVKQAGSIFRTRKKLPSLPLPNPILDPVSHLKHTNLEDLHRLTKDHVKQNIRIVEKACENEIDEYEKVCETHKTLRKMVVSQTLETRIKQLITNSNGPSVKAWQLASQEEIAAVCIRYLESQDVSPYSYIRKQELHLPGANELSSISCIKEYRIHSSCLPWFAALNRLPNIVLTSIFIYILIKTGWNPAALAQIQPHEIQAKSDGTYEIQAYKGKTDDETPVYTVTRNQHYLKKCIDLIIWNRKQLEIIEQIPDNKTTMWGGWTRNYHDNHFANPITAPKISSFCKRNNLKIFRPSDLRPLRASMAYLPKKDIEAVRVLLGHMDLQTSTEYLKDHLFFRMHEAAILEFQRRIEATIMFASKGMVGISLHRMNPDHVNKPLLMATGDGGACKNILDIPERKHSKNNEICDGLLCHQGNGCKNYRTLINEVSIEMALRTREYYRTRWKALIEKNIEAFTKIHVPRIIYMHVLLTIVKERRPDLIRKAQKSFLPCHIT